ncbi:MAG TPA: preprotein translocase subunit YajC [Flavobacteriaceae bacterium]|mgnify:FL=1|jgi:preprotein translocase subunit YajC|nr:preprotein translocase subunit YajC [Flavobacteriaceae bacterium]
MESQLPFLLLIAIVFLFFIVLPQSRRNKKEKNFLSSLKRGDRIITKSGIHARVIEFDNKNNTCVVETMAGKLKIEKAAISLEMSSKLNV